MQAANSRQRRQPAHTSSTKSGDGCGATHDAEAAHVRNTDTRRPTRETQEDRITMQRTQTAGRDRDKIKARGINVAKRAQHGHTETPAATCRANAVVENLEKKVE